MKIVKTPEQIDSLSQQIAQQQILIDYLLKMVTSADKQEEDEQE